MNWDVNIPHKLTLSPTNLEQPLNIAVELDDLTTLITYIP